MVVKMIQVTEISVIHHINKRKDKKHMIILRDIEKVQDKIKHILMVKQQTNKNLKSNSIEHISQHNNSCL